MVSLKAQFTATVDTPRNGSRGHSISSKDINNLTHFFSGAPIQIKAQKGRRGEGNGEGKSHHTHGTHKS